MLAPARPKLSIDLIDEDKLVDLSNLDAVRETLTLARQSVSVVEWLENRLHPWTSYVIVPLFAFANAGISVTGGALKHAASSRVALGFVFGLVVGKTAGITIASWLALRFRVAELPEGLTLRAIAAVAALGGVGFTVSLLVAGLAFSDPSSQANAKIGIIAATVAAGVVGTILIRRSISQTRAASSRST